MIITTIGSVTLRVRCSLMPKSGRKKKERVADFSV